MQNGTYYLNKDFKIKGNVSYKYLKSFKCGEDEISLNENSFEYNPSDNKKGLYELKVTDKAGQSFISTVNVFYDEKAPEVEFTVSPVVERNQKKNLINGEITVSGTASDKEDKVSFTKLILNDEEVTDSSGNPLSDKGVTKSVYSDNGMRFTYKIDTTKYDDKNNLKIEILSQDRAGNQINESETYYVDQETDKPVISSSTLNFEAKDAKDNKFGIEGKNITITAEDDDGVNSIDYIIKDSSLTTVKKETISADNKTLITKTIVLPDDIVTGKYTIQFTVKDKNDTPVTCVTEEIPFAYDNDYPVIKDIKIGARTYEASMFVKKDDKLSLKAQDKAGIDEDEVKVVIKKDGLKLKDITLVKNQDNQDVYETEDNLGSADGEYEAEISAYDIFGRSQTTSLSFKIDTVPPEWKENKGTSENPNLVNSYTVIQGGSKTANELEVTSFWFNQTAITLSGSAYDKNGIDKYSLKITNSENSNPDPVEISGSLSYKITSDLYKQGSNTAHLIVYDKAGNSSEKEISIRVDSVSPSVTTAILKNSSNGKRIESRKNLTQRDSVTQVKI